MTDRTPLQPMYPRSGYDEVGGLVFFPRMLDKIRLQAAGNLPPDYKTGSGLDERMCRFLGVDYSHIVPVALASTDEETLVWCLAQGRKPDAQAILHFNAFLRKRGWRDEYSDKLRASKEKRGWAAREDLQTLFDLQDAEEGRR